MTNIVIHVEGGSVQAVFADDKDVNVTVLDLDISDYPDPDEEREKEENAKRLDNIINGNEYHVVW